MSSYTEYDAAEDDPLADPPEIEVSAKAPEPPTEPPADGVTTASEEHPAENSISAAVALVSNDSLALIKATIAPDLSDAELHLFAAVCNRVGLDPFARQIYAIKRNDRNAPGGKKISFQTSIDGYRLIARRTGRMAGRLGPYFADDDGDWKIGPDGMPLPWLASEAPKAALVGVLRHGDLTPTWGLARWSEYCPPSGQDQMWLKMPTTMIGKCAEAQAIRATFPAETSGIYTEEEMMQADAIPAASFVSNGGASAPGVIDPWTAHPREVRDALKIRELNLGGKIEDLRQRLADALALETPAPVAEPEPAAPAGDVEGEGIAGDKMQAEYGGSAPDGIIETTATVKEPESSPTGSESDGAESGDETPPKPETAPETAPKAEPPKTKAQAVKMAKAAVDEMTNDAVSDMIRRFDHEPPEDSVAARGVLIGLLADDSFPPDDPQG